MPSDNTYKYFVPLTNFESKFTSIKLAFGYLIRKISKAERKILEKYNIGWPKIAYGDFTIECVSTKETLKQDFGLWAIQLERTIEKAVFAFRLYKEGIVGYNVIVLIPQVKTEQCLGLHRRPWSSADVLESQEKYEISHHEIQDLQKFFAEFIALPLNDLTLAARYFNKSYEEIDTHDSFVDLIIALESLYLKGENLELGYKLRMRMSHILSRDSAKRKSIYDTVKKAYKLRGDIIHGAKLPAIDPALLLEIRKYARESLQIFIKKPIRRDNLDEIILRPGSHYP